MVLHADEIPEDPNDIKEGDSEVVRLIKEVLVTRIRPRINAEGGDKFFQNFDTKRGLVTVKV